MRLYFFKSKKCRAIVEEFFRKTLFCELKAKSTFNKFFRYFNQTNIAK